jgi:hypothetical protein
MRWTGMLFVHSWRSAALVGLFLLASSAPQSWCQSGDQASLTGTAFDASGALIFGAHVKVRALHTSFSASTTTNEHGLFRFAILPVGLYELTADHAGFATVQVNNIDLTVGANLTLTLRFSVAGAKETTTVTDEPLSWRRAGANSARPSTIALSRSCRSTAAISQHLYC